MDDIPEHFSELGAISSKSSIGWRDVEVQQPGVNEGGEAQTSQNHLVDGICHVFAESFLTYGSIFVFPRYHSRVGNLTHGNVQDDV